MNDLKQLTERAEILIQTLTATMMEGAEKVTGHIKDVVDAATESGVRRIQAATDMAQTMAVLRMRAAQLDLIDREKKKIRESITEGVSESARRLFEMQIGLLESQERGVLEAAGVRASDSERVIRDADQKVYERDGRRFRQLEAAKGG